MPVHLGRLGEAIALDEAEHRRLSDLGQFGLCPRSIQSLPVSPADDRRLAGGAGLRPRVQGPRRAGRGDLARAGPDISRPRRAWEGDLEAARSIAVEASARQEAAGRPVGGGRSLRAARLHRGVRYPTLQRPSRTCRGVSGTPTRWELDCQPSSDSWAISSKPRSWPAELALAERVLRDRLEVPATRLPLPWIRAMAARGWGLLLPRAGSSTMRSSTSTGPLTSLTDEASDALRARPSPARTRLRSTSARRSPPSRAAGRDERTPDVRGARGTGLAPTGGQELARIGGRTSAGTALSASERMVAELAAAGHSNREIAAELVVSVRTVESQLSAAYRKLDIPRAPRLPRRARDQRGGWNRRAVLRAGKFRGSTDAPPLQAGLPSRSWLTRGGGSSSSSGMSRRSVRPPLGLPAVRPADSARSTPRHL